MNTLQDSARQPPPAEERPPPASGATDPARRGEAWGRRHRRPSISFGRGLRTGLAASVLVHGALGAFLVLAGAGRGEAPRGPLTFSAGIETVLPPERDPEVEPIPPPEVRPPEEAPEEDPAPAEPVADPRFEGEPEPPGDPDSHIGIAVPGGTNRPVAGGRRRPRPGGRVEAPAPAAVAEIPPPPPPPEPVFVEARRIDELCRKPEYPRREHERGITGDGKLRVRVGPDGNVLDVEVERSSGSASLDAAAVEAVRTWRFEPATRGGVPVESVVGQPFRFTLEDRP